MVKTKILAGSIKQSDWKQSLESKINEFLLENKVEIVDIKFSSFTRPDYEELIALLIYKECEN